MNFLAPLVIPLAPVEAAMVATTLLVLIVGVPVVIASVRVPGRLLIVPVPPEDLTARQRRWLDDIEARLRTEGYVEALTFSAPNLPSENLSRAWTSDASPAMAMATVGRSENGDTVTTASYVELVTEFSDGTGVTTRTSAQSDLFDPLPGSSIHVHRYLRDPVEVLRRHEAHCAGRELRKQPVHYPRQDFAQVIGSFHERWVAHQVARGLLWPTGDGDHRPTLRLALRGVASYFDPFEETVDLWKLVAVLLGGFALPLLANLALLDARIPLSGIVEASVGLGPAAALAISMAPVMWLAGAFVGWVIPNNTYVWPAICAWSSSRLLLGEAQGDWIATGIWLGALALVPSAANRASRLRARWHGLL